MGLIKNFADFAGANHQIHVDAVKYVVGNVIKSLSSWMDDVETSISNIEQDIEGKENSSNKVTSLSSQSDNTHYPGALCVFNALNGKVDKNNPSFIGNMTVDGNFTSTGLYLTGGEIESQDSDGLVLKSDDTGASSLELGTDGNTILSADSFRIQDSLVFTEGAIGAANNVGALTLKSNDDQPGFPPATSIVLTQAEGSNFIQLKVGNTTLNITEEKLQKLAQLLA